MCFSQHRYFWKKSPSDLPQLSGHPPWLRTRWPPHSSRTSSPISRTCSWTAREWKIGNPFKKDGVDVCTWRASTNKGNAFSWCHSTVQRQCCACLGAWRRWAKWVSGLCSPATAAWLPGGRARHGETALAALCTPPASHGPPPLLRHRHLRGHGPAATGTKNW